MPFFLSSHAYSNIFFSRSSYTVIVTRCCEACAKNPCELCDEASKQVCVACSQNELETVLCSKCAIQQKLVPKYVPPPTRRLGGCSNSGILLVGEGDGEGIESNMRVFDLRGAMLVQDV